MATKPQKRTLTSLELLRFRESRWRPRLESSSLAVEVLDEISQQNREQALTVLGRIVGRADRPQEQKRLLRRWPAVQVITMSGAAADHYTSGSFWPWFDELLLTPSDQYVRRRWGQAFLDNLRTLGLPTFDGDKDAGTRYVGRMLMHSGIPTFCLGDYFTLVQDRRVKTPGLTPEEFVSWAAARAAAGQLWDVDKPVSRFLHYGGEFAVDLTSRSFDLIDAVLGGGDGRDVPLPARYRDMVVALSASLAPSQQRVHRADGSLAVDHPRLVVDPFGQGLMLRLPAVGDAPDGTAVWIVSFDGISQRVATTALVPGSNEPAPATEVSIPRPVRTVSAALQGREHLQSVINVLGDDDALLAFEDGGRSIPSGQPLPASPTWLLFPGTRSDIEISGEFEFLSESPLPPRWQGWSLVYVDLSKATGVTTRHGASRQVHQRSVAKIHFPSLLEGVRSQDGQPVYGDVPTVELPADLMGATWTVTLSDFEGSLLARWDSRSENKDPNSVWDSISRPALGTYALRVRGPWGRGASRTFTVIEGLTVTFSPEWRRFTDEGLQVGSARLSAPAQLAVSESQLSYAPDVQVRSVRVGVGSSARTLVITPPHMTVSFQGDEELLAPASHRVVLFRERLDNDPGELLVDIGMPAEPTLHYRVSGFGAVQEILPRGGNAGIYRFPLAQLRDTLNRHPHGTLALDPAGEVTVAQIRPQRLCSAITLAGTELVFEDCVDVAGLTAHTYLMTAPWRGPTSLPVRAGRAQLPEDLQQAGSLKVLLRIEDPWAPAAAPAWPEVRQSTVVVEAGAARDDDPEARQLAGYLAGECPFPEHTDGLSRLWITRALVPSLGLGERTWEVADQLDTALVSNPRASLLALSGSDIPATSIPHLVVRSGLVDAPLNRFHDDEAPSWTSSNAVASALLSSADGHWSSSEIDAAIAVCGDILTELLGGRDPAASAGRLDSGADLFDRNPNLRDAFVRQAQLVPSGLLSGDSRVAAVMDFVRDRRNDRLVYLTKHSKGILAEGLRLLQLLDDRVGAQAVNARLDHGASHGWKIIPAVSLSFSFAARHASRGNDMATNWVQRQRRCWSDLAAVAPSMVTIDTIIAELLVASQTATKENTRGHEH